MIIVVDYNVGNVKSVCNAFKYIGCDVGLSADSETIKKADGLVLPGVAAFGYAISQLDVLADAVLMASITHFENYTIKQIKQYLGKRGIAVNLPAQGEVEL